MTIGMTIGLARADAHIEQLLQRAKFDRGQLAVVPDHSQVRAYRYENHLLEDGVLRIRYREEGEDPALAHESNYSLDEDVYALGERGAAFYRDARLLTIVLVESAAKENQ